MIIREVPMNSEEVKALQVELESLGFDIGASGPDGVFGPKTKKAYEGYLATRHKDVVVMVPNAAIPWWESRAMWSSLATVAAGVGTLATIAGTGGVAALAAPEAIGAMVAVFTGLGGVIGTAARKSTIDPNLVVGKVRITRSV